jgi:CubicO group peptidase (beta-lactamase class C family)
MHFKQTVLKILLVAASLSATIASAADVAPPQSIDSAIAKRMEEAGVMGLGAAVIIGGKVVWAKGYGYADKEHGVPFTPATVMNIGSISKTVTGVAMMRAVQEGKLSLDADINRYLPFKVVNPYHPAERITLRQLATHTAGIADHPTVYRDSYHFGGDATEPLGDFLKGYFVPGGATYSKDNFVDAKPGTQREYSNIGAGLAGYIVERAVGEKLNTYTKRIIFTPLKMNDTGWFLSEIPAAKHATLYVAQDGITIPILPYGLTTYPDGGVRTSVADLSKFFIALLGDGSYEGARILSAAAVQEMTRFQFSEANKPLNTVLTKENSGLFWATKMSVTRVGHGGSDPGLKTEMLANLVKDIGIVMFINTSLPEQDIRHYVSLYKALWAHAEALKLAQIGSAGK